MGWTIISFIWFKYQLLPSNGMQLPIRREIQNFMLLVKGQLMLGDTFFINVTGNRLEHTLLWIIINFFVDYSVLNNVHITLRWRMYIQCFKFSLSKAEKFHEAKFKWNMKNILPLTILFTIVSLLLRFHATENTIWTI